jgi:DNA polymerase-1
LESDFLKLAMVESRRALVSKGYWLNGASMILSIHDELLFEVRDDIIKEIVPLLRESMERVYPQFPVALRVEISCGKDWGHLEKY